VWRIFKNDLNKQTDNKKERNEKENLDKERKKWVEQGNNNKEMKGRNGRE
jgi:hypothetical protein